MRRIILFIGIFLIPTVLSARSANDTFTDVYRLTRTGCSENTVTTTGHNRSAQLNANSAYLIYGYDQASIGTGITIECVLGTSTIDVTGLSGSLAGQLIFANQQMIFYTTADARYVSCISESASKHYALCLQ